MTSCGHLNFRIVFVVWRLLDVRGSGVQMTH
ncbi:hypothetical protein LINPERPRIM_LOCUS274 [Linum perenne]